MLNDYPISMPTPLFSVVIAVYNDWEPLEQCLRSLEQQSDRPEFEVIVVDDGSDEEAPASIRQWTRSYQLTIIRQIHSGIASARNRGIRNSRGSVLLFTDADCRLQTNCLAALDAVILDSPQHNCFQLHLTGDCSSIVGRAEELRLTTLQNLMLQPDGRIRYLNTAGFAIRRAHLDLKAGLFDPVALRGEDTLVLVNLMQRGELPLFAPSAFVQHAVSLTLVGCLRKDVRAAWLEAKTYEIIAEKGVRLRMGHRDRLDMLLSMWKTSRQCSIGTSGWFVAVVRQLLQRIVSFSYRYIAIRTNTHVPANEK
jgi:glycosyltransferase involved in cell wall biosynthesis